MTKSELREALKASPAEDNEELSLQRDNLHQRVNRFKLCFGKEVVLYNIELQD